MVQCVYRTCNCMFDALHIRSTAKVVLVLSVSWALVCI